MDDQEFLNCPACQSQRMKPWAQTSSYPYWECEICGSVTAWPRPSQDALAAMHKAEEYFQKPYFSERRTSTSSLARARYIADRVREQPGFYRLIESGIPLAHLDIGCDTGEFMDQLSRLLPTQPIGLEINGRAAERGRARQRDIVCTVLEGYQPQKSFDLITALDVIEHLSDPLQAMRDLASWLSVGGSLYVEVPNVRALPYQLGRLLCKSSMARDTGSLARLFPPEHPQYFTPLGLTMAIRSSGFSNIRTWVRPLRSDELSEVGRFKLPLQALQVLDRTRGGSLILCGLANSPTHPTTNRSVPL